MERPDDSPDESTDRIASDLADGLTSCRAVLDDYRAKFLAGGKVSGGTGADEPDERPEPA